MLGDYDVGEFKHKLDKMVDDFLLQENKRVREMYGNCHMSATAYNRGKKIC
jgi:hypothetical protein